MKRFVDLFAGCGGLSLGLVMAGWKGLFAIEKSPDAFATLKSNLVDGDFVAPFDWPEWLPCEPMTTSSLIQNHSDRLRKLRGTVDIVAGGPPCQGFSFAGRRNPDDPRNSLTEEYLEIVKLVKPRYLLLENVKGFKSAFRRHESDKGKVYSDIIKKKLKGYKTFDKVLDASLFGVPQFRQRFIMIAIRRDVFKGSSPFQALEDMIVEHKKGKRLPLAREMTVKEAISDLETKNANLIPFKERPGFQQLEYRPRKLTNYQRLMREQVSGDVEPNSLRLARHNNNTVARFKTVLKQYPKGKSLSQSDLQRLGTKKQCFTPLHPDLPSKTLTTLPDDLLHYSEPRILTVRESARIQSFPDWFDFRGKYTTGGARRREECPRYTQVGNAVPPLMAEVLGNLIDEVEKD
ncbi:MAG: DNA cytosine methyltransferase [Thermodesulfobacteriota bacterium]